MKARSTLLGGVLLAGLLGVTMGCQPLAWLVPWRGAGTSYSVSPEREAEARAVRECASVCARRVESMVHPFLAGDDPDWKVKAKRFAAGETLGEYLAGDAMLFAVRLGVSPGLVQTIFGEPRLARSSGKDRMAGLLVETEHIGELGFKDWPVKWEYNQYGVRVDFTTSALDWFPHPPPSPFTYERVTGVMEP
jgi:hypothetical protein